MSADCKLWMATSDREAVGDTLDESERHFLRTHPASCEECAAEADVWRDIEGLVDEVEADEVDVPLRSRRAPRMPDVGVPPRFFRTRTVAAVAALGLVAGMAWAVWPRSHAPVAVAAATHPAPGVARLTVITRDAEVDGHPAVIGAALAPGSVVKTREGTACLALDHGVRACLLPGGAVKVADVGEHRKLEVTVGKLVADLDPQAPGTSFSVMTRDGSVTAVGTSFSVEVPADGAPVVARVLHGAVLVNGPRGEQHALSAHAQVTMGTAPHPLLRDEESSEWAAVRDAMMLAGGTHVRRVEQETVAVAPSSVPGPSVSVPFKAPVASAPRVNAPATSASSEAPSLEAPSELLLRARAARGRGDLAEATRLYRELTANHPASAEAHASLVSLGDVLLSTGDAQGALTSFEAYQRTSGPLSQEAAYGRIRALRSLGRAAEERAAILSFFDAYPQAPQIPSLRVRLTGIDP
jgi:ferric-dicitrate binding protein FerR (iron transport regulator)